MVEFIGYLAGFLAMISFVPQVIKTIRSKRADDISMSMLLLTLITNLLFVAYGVALHLKPITIMIGIMSGVVILQIWLTLKYRHKHIPDNSTNRDTQ
jgi:MtN3 and saliva related transmembrane protein